MVVECYGSEFEIPDLLVNMFVKDFETLPGSGHREGIYQIRESIDSILNTVAENPNILHRGDYHTDFIRALAMKQALEELGILYDS